MRLCNKRLIHDVPGELKITFMKSYCGLGNFSLLLRDERLPPLLQPYIRELRSIIDPQPFRNKTFPSSDPRPLEKELYQQLINRLNADFANDCVWISSSEWSLLPSVVAATRAPVQSHARYVHRVTHNNVTFATYDDNPANSVVQLRCNAPGTVLFGRITSIFLHQRRPLDMDSMVVETWLSVELLPPVPASYPNPFVRLAQPDVQAFLRFNKPTPPQLFNITQVDCHCAWLIYEAGQVNAHLDIPTIALVSLDRS